MLVSERIVKSDLAFHFLTFLPAVDFLAAFLVVFLAAGFLAAFLMVFLATFFGAVVFLATTIS